MLDSESDDSRGEEISLAEARRPYQISMVSNADREVLTAEKGRHSICHHLKKLLPHVALLMLTFGYICAVAVAYFFIEGDNEKMERAKTALAVEMTQRNLMVQLHSLAPDIPVDRLRQETEKFSRELLQLGWAKGRLGIPVPMGAAGTPADSEDNANVSAPLWSLANSLLFATSIISRIGFGHLVPLTSLGKMLLFPCVLLGTPLFLVTLADLGKPFSNLCTMFYLNIWPLLRGWRKSCASAAAKAAGNKSKSLGATPATSLNHQPVAEEGAGVEEWQLDDEEEVVELTLPTTLLFVWLLLGWALLACLYSLLEGWAWLDCFYFTFVTFSSIGFGDFAPSSALSALVTVCLVFPRSEERRVGKECRN